MIQLLDEAAAWTPGVRAVALGIAYDDESTVTFSVIRVAAEPTQIDKVLTTPSAAVTRAGDTIVRWVGGRGNVAAFWRDRDSVVTLYGSDVDTVAALVAAWLKTGGSDAAVIPPEVPDVVDVETAIAKGPPMDRLPPEYDVFVLNPLAFAKSDFADAVTFGEIGAVDRLGAAVIVADDVVAATAVAAAGRSIGLSEWSSRFSTGSGRGAVARGFEEGEIDVLIVGYDPRVISRLANTWRDNIPRSR